MGCRPGQLDRAQPRSEAPPTGEPDLADIEISPRNRLPHGVMRKFWNKVDSPPSDRPPFSEPVMGRLRWGMPLRRDDALHWRRQYDAPRKHLRLTQPCPRGQSCRNRLTLVPCTDAEVGGRRPVMPRRGRRATSSCLGRFRTKRIPLVRFQAKRATDRAWSRWKELEQSTGVQQAQAKSISVESKEHSPNHFPHSSIVNGCQ